MSTETSQHPCPSLEENLKKALTELLILHLLSQRDYYIGDLTESLKQRSGGTLNLVFPYSAVYRLQDEGHIVTSDKRVAADGRKRQFYCISECGRNYYKDLRDTYQYFINGVTMILETDHS